MVKYKGTQWNGKRYFSFHSRKESFNDENNKSETKENKYPIVILFFLSFLVWQSCHYHLVLVKDRIMKFQAKPELLRLFAKPRLDCIHLHLILIRDICAGRWEGGGWRQNVLNLIWKKKSRICPILGQSDPLWARIWWPWLTFNCICCWWRQRFIKTNHVWVYWVAELPSHGLQYEFK